MPPADRRQKIERHLEEVRSFAGAKQLLCANQIETILSARRSGSGPAYLAPDTIQPQGEAIRVERGNAEVLRAYFESMIDNIEDVQPCFAVLDGCDAAYGGNPVPHLFPIFDFSFFVAMAMSLLAIAFSYDAFSGEKEGTGSVKLGKIAIT